MSSTPPNRDQNAGGDAVPRPSAKAARWTARITLILAVLILVPSLYGFGSKFIEFVHVFSGETEGAFAIAPILNYLLASAGFFLLLLWAIANGMFHDIEKPKYTMLEREQQLDSGKLKPSN